MSNWLDFNILKAKVADGYGIRKSLVMLGMGRGAYWKYTTDRQRKELMEIRKASQFRNDRTDAQHKQIDKFLLNAY